MFIALEGLIGSGKSVFCHHLGQVLINQTNKPVVVQYEPVEDNPFLRVFYTDMKRWAYTMQMHLLHCRYRMHQQAATSDVPVIQDRSLYGDVCFARLAHSRGNMTADEFQSYEKARGNMMMHMVYPDLIIYLDISAEQAARRITARDRSGEAIPSDYLKGLRREYEGMLARLGTHCPVVRIAWSDFTDGEIADRVADTWAVARESLREDWTRRQGG